MLPCRCPQLSNFYSFVYVKVLFAQSCLILCNPMDCSLPGSSVHGIFLGKNTGVGSYSLLQGIFLTQELNPCLLFLLLSKITNLAKCNHHTSNLQHLHSWVSLGGNTHSCWVISLRTCQCILLSSCIIFLVLEFSPFLGPLVPFFFLQALKTSSILTHDIDS